LLSHDANDEHEIVADGGRRVQHLIHVPRRPFPLARYHQHDEYEAQEDRHRYPHGATERQGEDVADEGQRGLAKYEGRPSRGI
jgi:hypothetical protein